ncbi:MAG: gamma-glutamylcyclotransferase [Clostridiales bacterium]|jgi:gamma-glutamylcyclotransferase (GGCT)/AIG2-like uncharacterized protein YtfP|nr:gamma-glutamylcyclotransferase [Eubacteriales bacterium]MDH7567905.1 gamma-glutamylcyclotransferase [Clostridiales bacterium]
MCKGKTLYIAYGSNLNLGQMAVRCPTARAVGSTTLKDYQLLFRGFSGGAAATVEKKPGSSVPVLVWELEPSDEAALDRYEGYPAFYRKEYIKVRLNGKQVQAMIYIMNEGRPLGMPGRRYYNTILEGYKAAGFDTGILNKAVQVSAGHGG